MILQELIKHVLSFLVEHKEAISVHQEDVDGRMVFKITVDERDLGRVIGREGQTIRAIRTLVAVANTSDTPISVDICE